MKKSEAKEEMIKAAEEFTKIYNVTSGSGMPNKTDNIFISFVENPPNPSCKITKIIKVKEMNKMAKGKPKQNSSGGGTRSNRGRGGCGTTRNTGQGRNPKK